MNRNSIKAYHEITEEGIISRGQRDVLNLIRKYPCHTCQEMETSEGDPNIHKRVSELLKLGLVAVNGIRKCDITGRTANTYRATGQTMFTKHPAKPSRRQLEKRLAMLEAYTAAHTRSLSDSYDAAYKAGWLARNAGLALPEDL
jgi:hypothetical protein